MFSNYHLALLKWVLLRGGLLLLGGAFLLAQSTKVGRSTDEPMVNQQNTMHNLYFNTLSDKTSLVDNVNAFIYHDSRGFVWLSSMSGVNRFDGTKVKQYGTQQKICPQSTFFETKNGDIWFTTPNTIQVYRRKLDKFEQFVLTKPSGDTIRQNYHAFFLDKQERLWVRILESSEKSYIFDTQNYRQQEICEIPHLRVKPYLNEQNNQLSLFAYDWNNHGFRQYIFKDSSNYTQPIIKDWTPKHYPSLSNLSIFNIQPLGDTAVWLGTNQGLVYFHLAKQIFKKFNTIPLTIAANKNEISVGNVKSIALLENGMVAVGTSSQGLLLFNTKTQLFDYQYYLKPYQANSGEMPFTEIHDLYLDPTYNLWVSSWSSGVAYTNLKTQSWEHITLAKLPKKFEVVKILERSNGEIWAMSNGEGIAVLNQKGDILRYYTHRDLPTDRYKQVEEDSLGRVWLVGRSHAAVYVPNAKQFYLLNQAQKGISFKNFTILPNKTVVGLTENGQLYSPQIQSNGQIDYTLVSNFSNFSKHLAQQHHHLKMMFNNGTNVYAIAADTIYKLVYTPSVKQWEIVNLWKHQLQDANIYSNANNSFLLNNNEFILYFDKQTAQQYYISSSTLNLANIESAIDIGNRQILVMGQDRINLHDLNNGSTTQIAMLTRYLSFGSKHLKNKEIWVGTVTGIVKLKPTDFDSQSEQTTIQLTRLQINDEFEYQKGNVGELANFILPSNHQTLTFGMTAISYNYVFRPVLRYKLEYVDNDFLSSNSSAMEVRYAKLDYGNYRLVMEALDSRSNKVLVRKEIHITIETPIWLRTWALVLYALIAVGLFWWGVTLWIRRAQRKTQMQKQLSDNQITSLRAQINPHFIVNSVVSISSLIRKHLNVQALEAVEHFSLILNRTLHASDNNKITLKEEIEILEKYIVMEELTRETAIDFEVTYDDAIDPENIEMPTFILQLFVENAVKHGIINKVYLNGERPAIRIAFEIKYIKNIEILEAVITDNGIGYDPNNASNKKEVRKRASLGMKLVRERLKLILQLRQHRNMLDSLKDKLLSRKRKVNFDPISIKCLYDEVEKRPIGTQVTVLIPLEA